MRSLSGSRPEALSTQSVAHTEHVQPACWGAMYRPRLESKYQYQSGCSSPKGRARNCARLLVPVIDGLVAIGLADRVAFLLDFVDLVGGGRIARVEHGHLNAFADGELHSLPPQCG